MYNIHSWQLKHQHWLYVRRYRGYINSLDLNAAFANLVFDVIVLEKHDAFHFFL